nr:translation initiation factor IF-2-like [Macaca fascicularis]
MALRTATSWHGTAGPRRSARGGEARGPRATLGRRGRPEPEATPAPAGPGRAAGAQLRVAGRVSMHGAGEELLGTRGLARTAAAAAAAGLEPGGLGPRALAAGAGVGAHSPPSPRAPSASRPGPAPAPAPAARPGTPPRASGRGRGEAGGRAGALGRSRRRRLPARPGSQLLPRRSHAPAGGRAAGPGGGLGWGGRWEGPSRGRRLAVRPPGRRRGELGRGPLFTPASPLRPGDPWGNGLRASPRGQGQGPGAPGEGERPAGPRPVACAKRPGRAASVSG